MGDADTQDPDAGHTAAFKTRMFDDSTSQPVLLPRLSLFPAGYKPLPIREALREIKPELYDVDDMVSTCESFTRHQAVVPRGLTQGDAFALSFYTYEIPVPGNARKNLYFRLNSLMRERSDEIFLWKHYIWHMLSALRRMPPFEGFVFRGIDRHVDAARHQPGRRVYWNSFTSTSSVEDVAKKFMRSSKTGTFFTIKVKRGRSLKGLSPFDEDEVLLEANSEFVVTSFVELGTFLMVSLEEVDSTRALMPLDWAPPPAEEFAHKKKKKSDKHKEKKSSASSSAQGSASTSPAPQQQKQKTACRVCQSTIVIGTRYKCLECYDYNQCERCHAAKRTSHWHLPAHAMECIAPGDLPGPSPQRPLAAVLGKRVRRGRDWK
eukprot:m51a1_g3065 hypothetical protein (377) ;mRNA; r:25-1616